MNISPRPLLPGDRIAIVSPAGIPVPENVEAAAEILSKEGWKPYISPNALGKHGSYSGSAEARFSDLSDALVNPDVKAILCSRGGYGVVHIMERLAKLPIQNNPKWIIGFSDISALHALMVSKGLCSIHASMAKHISKGPDDPDNDVLFRILRGERPAMSFEAGKNDRPGVADGMLVGGNLAVLADLISTPYDILKPDTILFLEDVAEPVYKIERIMYQLRLNGVLPKLKGLVVGQFTDYKGDLNHSCMEDMIMDMVAPYDYPVAFNVPIGHVDHNVPVIEGAHVTLKVTPDSDTENHLIYWH